MKLAGCTAGMPQSAVITSLP